MCPHPLIGPFADRAFKGRMQIGRSGEHVGSPIVGLRNLDPLHAQAETNARLAHDLGREKRNVEHTCNERRKRRRGRWHAEERHFYATPIANISEEGDRPSRPRIAHDLDRRRRLLRKKTAGIRGPAASPECGGDIGIGDLLIDSGRPEVQPQETDRGELPIALMGGADHGGFTGAEPRPPEVLVLEDDLFDS